MIKNSEEFESGVIRSLWWVLESGMIRTLWEVLESGIELCGYDLYQV